MYNISLNNNSLSYFVSRGSLGELSGSSKYNLFDNEVVIKQKNPKPVIEQKTFQIQYLNSMLTDNMSDKLMERIVINRDRLLNKMKVIECQNTFNVDLLEKYNYLISSASKNGSDFVIKKSLMSERVAENERNYKKNAGKRSSFNRVNKTKVKGKMYALFNLIDSRHFIAFYSVSFPIHSSDDACFICWNAWLTFLRKECKLSNYIWVCERQKNGTLHYHMLTNNRLPIKQVNHAMSIIIDNQVKKNVMSWGLPKIYTIKTKTPEGIIAETVTSDPCAANYNGVDVDDIYNSKRHKRTGKTLNPVQLRSWIGKYITKYVSKNNDKFLHLCWHCSRSVSELFTSTVYPINESRNVTDFLPPDESLYITVVGQFNTTKIFKFNPPPILFEKIIAYNNFVYSSNVRESLLPELRKNTLINKIKNL